MTLEHMLIAAAGLAGSGKTTSLDFLASIGAGAYFYVGGIVRAEVRARGLEMSPDNEREVREALRREAGMAVLAARAAPHLRSRLDAGETILIDAICNTEEGDYYSDTFGGDLVVLGLNAPFETRVVRLAARDIRPMTREQLRERDRYEVCDLQIDKVLVSADVTLPNCGTIAELEVDLRDFASSHFCRSWVRRTFPDAHASTAGCD